MLRYFVDADHINVSDITATEYEDPENQVMDNNLEVGESTRNLAAEMIEEGMEHIVSAFVGHVRLFYCRFVDKKFPFQSTLLSD